MPVQPSLPREPFSSLPSYPESTTETETQGSKGSIGKRTIEVVKPSVWDQMRSLFNKFINLIAHTFNSFTKHLETKTKPKTKERKITVANSLHLKTSTTHGLGQEILSPKKTTVADKEMIGGERGIDKGRNLASSHVGKASIGTLTDEEGRIYEGPMINGKPIDGLAKITYPDGKVFEGLCKNGKPDGQGILRYPFHNQSIRSFEGEFREDEMNSPYLKGVMTYADGEKVAGTYEYSWGEDDFTQVVGPQLKLIPEDEIPKY